MPHRELRIRPLSEGIGLGSLKATSKQTNQNSAPQNSVSGATASNHDIDTSIMRQAHAAYAPHSVGSEIRRQRVTKWSVAIIRFMADTGTDIFVGTLTAMILAWSGVLAWNAGSGGSIDPMGALFTVLEFVGRASLPHAVVALLVLSFSWRLVRIIFSRV